MEFSKFKFSHFLERISAYLNEEKTATKPFLKKECLEIFLGQGVNDGQRRSYEAGKGEMLELIRRNQLTGKRFDV